MTKQTEAQRLADDLQIQYAEIEPIVGYHVGKWLAYVALALLCVYLWVSYAAI